jgi:hypothetical protein
MTENFFPQKSDVILDAYDASVCQEGLHWRPVFNRLVKLYSAGSTLQTLRHIPVCKLCGERASITLNDKQVFISECLIKVDHQNFSVLVPSVFMHLAQGHGLCLSAESERVVLDGDLACYERLVVNQPKSDPGILPDLDTDGW